MILNSTGSMIGENRELVANEPVEFEKKQPVEVQDCRIITDHFRGIYKNIYIHPNLIRNTGGCEHVITGWTCKHKDLDR